MILLVQTNLLYPAVLNKEINREWYVFWLLFKIDLCSATSFKRSRLELSVDVAEHRSILKSSQNTYPHFSFTLKTGIELPKKDVLF